MSLTCEYSQINNNNNNERKIHKLVSGMNSKTKNLGSTDPLFKVPYPCCIRVVLISYQCYIGSFML